MSRCQWNTKQHSHQPNHGPMRHELSFKVLNSGVSICFSIFHHSSSVCGLCWCTCLLGVVQWVMSNCVLTWSCHIVSSTRPFLIVFVINYVVRMLFIHFLCCSSDCAAYSALLAIFLLSQPTPPCGWDVSYSLIINHYSCTTHCHGARSRDLLCCASWTISLVTVLA